MMLRLGVTLAAVWCGESWLAPRRPMRARNLIRTSIAKVPIRDAPDTPREDARTPPSIAVVHWDELERLTPAALATLREAFVGPKAYGVVGIRGVPGYAGARRAAFGAAVNLAVHDVHGRERAAAPRQTYPGWSGMPGRETHPLQSCFVHNVKETHGAAPRIDPFFGANRWHQADC